MAQTHAPPPVNVKSIVLVYFWKKRNVHNMYSHILTSNRFHAIIMVAKGVLVVFLKKNRETAVSRKKLQNLNNFFSS